MAISTADRVEILKYFSESQPFHFLGRERFSTLIAGLRDFREISGRNVDTGQYISDPNLRNEKWGGVLGYFALLDQIGGNFQHLNTTNSELNSIKFAIKEFGFHFINYDENVLAAIVSLRNAFAHDFNLISHPDKKKVKANEFHKFEVAYHEENIFVVELPKLGEEWDRNIEQKDFNQNSDRTKINLTAVGHIVEQIVKSVKTGIEKGLVEFKVSTYNAKIFLNKYTFIIN